MLRKGTLRRGLMGKCDFCGREKATIPYINGNGESIELCSTCTSIMFEYMLQLDLSGMDGNLLEPTALKKMKSIGELMGKTIIKYSSSRWIPGATPREIHQKLDESVIGQEDAKKALSIAVYSHLKRISSDNPNKIAKSNILMIGPTGSGKTLLANTLADICGVPFACVDATTYTQAGFVGDNVEKCLTTLLRNADGNLEMAQKGIIYIDEIDKIGKKTDGIMTRDAGGEGVQQALLKLIEGTSVILEERNGPIKQQISFDTSNVLFICGGAFEGLDALKKDSGNSIGFFAQGTEEDSGITALLTQYGMIPEFLGRLPVIVELNKLKKEELVSIIKEPQNSIYSQYKNLFMEDGIFLEIKDEVFDILAEQAIAYGTGARGLRSAFEGILREAIYDLPFDEGVNTCVIDKSTIDTGKYKLRWSEEYKENSNQLISLRAAQ